MFEHANMLVLKVTRDCNLRCKYCYIANKDQFIGEKMDYELYKKIINRVVIDRIKGNNTEHSFSIVFHGGEPTMIGKELLTKMFEYAQSTFISNGINFSLSMQTNLTKVDDSLSKLLSQYNVNIGFSFDGVGQGANDGRSKNLNDKFFDKKFEIMDKNGTSYGPLMVLNDANKDYVLEAIKFINDKLNKDIKINYAEDVTTAAEEEASEISGREFFEKNFKVILDNFIKTGAIGENNIMQIFQKYILSRTTVYKKTAAKGNCYIKVCGAGINVVEIEPDGGAYYCGRYSKEFEESKIQHVTDKDFLGMVQIKRHLDFTLNKHKSILEAGCDTCRADEICDHGCAAFHFSKYGTWGIRTDLVCEIYKPLYDYFAENEKELVEAYLNKYNGKKIYGVGAISSSKDNPLTSHILNLGYKIEVDMDGITIGR